MASKLEKTAYHEAGHAVAHILQDLPFDLVTIVPAGDALGYVVPGAYPEDFRPDLDGDGSFPAILRYVTVFLAGAVAEGIFAGRHNWRGAGQDLRNADNIGSYLACDPEETFAFFKWVLIRTRILLEVPENWAAVQGIAEALMDRKRLSEAEARSIFLGRDVTEATDG